MRDDLPPIPEVNTEFKDNVFFVFNEGTGRQNYTNVSNHSATYGKVETFHRLIKALDFLTFLTYPIAFFIIKGVEPVLFLVLGNVLGITSPRIAFLTFLWMIKPNFDMNGPIYNYRTIGKRFLDHISDK